MADFFSLASRLIGKYGKSINYSKSVESVEDGKPWNVSGKSTQTFSANTVIFENLNKTSPVDTNAEILGSFINGIVASKECDFALKAGHTLDVGGQKWIITNIKTTLSGNEDVVYSWRATK